MKAIITEYDYDHGDSVPTPGLEKRYVIRGEPVGPFPRKRYLEFFIEWHPRAATPTTDIPSYFDYLFEGKNDSPRSLEIEVPETFFDPRAHWMVDQQWSHQYSVLLGELSRLSRSNYDGEPY